MTDSQNLKIEATFSPVTVEVKRILHGVVITDIQDLLFCPGDEECSSTNNGTV
jgi:hypothetical protein